MARTDPDILAVRVPDILLARIDALTTNPDVPFSTATRSRSEAARMALNEGANVIENAAQKKAERRGRK